MPEVSCGFADDVSTGTTGKYNLALKGPTLLVDIGFDKTFVPNQGNKPTPDLTGVSALVDTGATECCIDNLLATKLGLPVVDKRNISGVGGKHVMNVYLAQIHVPNLGLTVWGPFVGVDLAAGGQIHNVLIGRTFLQSIFMTYDGTTGEVKLTKK